MSRELDCGRPSTYAVKIKGNKITFLGANLNCRNLQMQINKY